MNRKTNNNFTLNPISGLLEHQLCWWVLYFHYHPRMIVAHDTLGSRVQYINSFDILDNDIQSFFAEFFHVHQLCSNRNYNQVLDQVVMLDNDWILQFQMIPFVLQPKNSLNHDLRLEIFEIYLTIKNLPMVVTLIFEVPQI